MLLLLLLFLLSGAPLLRGARLLGGSMEELGILEGSMEELGILEGSMEELGGSMEELGRTGSSMVVW